MYRMQQKCKSIQVKCEHLSLLLPQFHQPEMYFYTSKSLLLLSFFLSFLHSFFFHLSLPFFLWSVRSGQPGLWVMKLCLWGTDCQLWPAAKLCATAKDCALCCSSSFHCGLLLWEWKHCWSSSRGWLPMMLCVSVCACVKLTYWADLCVCVCVWTPTGGWHLLVITGCSSWTVLLTHLPVCWWVYGICALAVRWGTDGVCEEEGEAGEHIYPLTR